MRCNRVPENMNNAAYNSLWIPAVITNDSRCHPSIWFWLSKLPVLTTVNRKLTRCYKSQVKFWCKPHPVAYWHPHWVFIFHTIKNNCLLPVTRISISIWKAKALKLKFDKYPHFHTKILIETKRINNFSCFSTKTSDGTPQVQAWHTPHFSRSKSG